MPNKRVHSFENALVNPIHQNATFHFSDTAEVIRYHEKEAALGRYGRYDNPSWLEVEKKLAQIEGCEEALLFPSGMSAIATAVLSFLGQGDRFIYTQNGYRNTRSLSATVLPRFGIETVPLSSSSIDFYDRLAESCDEKTRMILLETPSNPHLCLVDLERVKNIAGEILLAVDSTLSTPVNLQPRRFGADLVIHSCTKYLGGHADMMAGSVAGAVGLVDVIRQHRDVMGSIPEPHSAFLLNRSLATLRVRMEHINAAGMKMAAHLEKHPRVKRVYYTGLASHPHFAVARRCLSGHGGVVSFEIDGTSRQASRFIDSLTVPFMGTNFGSHQSMVEQCSIMTYYKLSDGERRELGISDGLIRMNVGYDEVDRLIDDLESAFRTTFQ